MIYQLSLSEYSYSISRVLSCFPKFQNAYDEFDSRLTFDIKTLDSSLQNLNNGDNTLALIGNSNYNNKYGTRFTNILLTRLCIYSLFKRRQNSFTSSSLSSLPLLPYVVIVDAGNSLDFYQFVEFIRQYGLDIKETLQRIVVSRAFTVHQLTNLIINELPSIIRKLDTCLVIVPDLMHMFTQDPTDIDHKEAKHLIKEIVSAIRKIAASSSRTRCVVSWNYKHHQSNLYINIASKFDQCIEVTSLVEKQESKLCLKIYDGQSSKDCKNGGAIHCLLQSNDLYFVPQR